MLNINKKIELSGFSISNSNPMIIIGGINVIESKELAFQAASQTTDLVKK